MKNLLKLLGTAMTLVLVAAGCSKNDFNINSNPNSPTTVNTPFRFVLPAAEVGTANAVATPWGFLQNYLGFWARSGTYAPNAQEESYQLTTNFGAGIWNQFYNVNYDFQVVQDGAVAAGAGFYEGIARIMKSHNYAILVDLYNNIPYSQALKGAANTSPSYDKGADIYKSLLRQIDSGMTSIKNSSRDKNANINIDDVMFGKSSTSDTSYDNQVKRWTRFGNTLKLRLLVHLMNGGITSSFGVTPNQTVPGFDVSGEIARLVADQTLGNATGFIMEDAQIQPGYSTVKPNPFYNTYIAGTDGASTANNIYYRANSYAVGGGSAAYSPGYYNYNGDARIDKFYAKPSSGVHKGVDYGLPSSTDNAAANLSGIGVGVSRGADKPVWILTAAESFFLQAEAAQRGYSIGGTPANLLNAGIRASFASLGNTVAQANSYITGNAGYVDVDINGTILFQGIQPGVYTVISQKWFALNAIAPYEVWTDYRRVDLTPNTKHFVYGVGSGFAAGPPISVYQFNTQTEIPKRLLYPQVEYNYNSANVTAEGNISAFTNRIFWDLN